MGYSYESFLERDRHPYVLVVGGSPERLPSTGVQHLARICDRVVAVDGGLDSILDGDITADVFCGDADSVGERSARCVSRAELGEASRVRSVERYDPYKDFTDLALALRAIDMRWGDAPLLCTGLSGGRTDHCLAAVGRLVSWGGPVAWEEPRFSARFMHAGDVWDLSDREGEAFSFVCLSQEAEVSEEGMEWTLDHKTVHLLDDLGISNVLHGGARVSCHRGSIVAFVIRASAV